MVVPPGWNVTEPIGLAIKSYEIAEKLKHAPRSAKTFKSKIERLGRLLSLLQEVLVRIGDGRAAPLPADNFAQLKEEVIALQERIQQCEEFIAKFVHLTGDGSKKSSAAAKARWVWDEKKGNEHAVQIESHIFLINLNLNIDTLYVTERLTLYHALTALSARAHALQVDIPREPVPSPSDTLATLPPYTSPKREGKQLQVDIPRKPVPSPSDTLATLPPYTSPKREGKQLQVDIPRKPVPSPSDTLATLPPYTSPKQEGKQKDWDKQPQTPGSIFGIPLEASPGDKSKDNGDACCWPFPTVASSWLPYPTVASTEAGPISPSKRISSALSLDGPFTPSGARSGTASSTSRSPFTSPDLPSRDGAERIRQGSVYSEFSLDSSSPQYLLQNLYSEFSLDSSSPQYLLQNLKNTWMCVSSLLYLHKATQLIRCHQHAGKEERKTVQKARRGDRDIPRL